MCYQCIEVARSGDFTTITMNRQRQRNALSGTHIDELIAAFGAAGESDAPGAVPAGNGAVFSAGHDVAELVDADYPAVRLLAAGTELMTTLQQIRRGR